MTRAMGQSQVLKTNNMLISIYFMSQGDFGDYMVVMTTAVDLTEVTDGQAS